jgi:hypothetical protein
MMRKAQRKFVQDDTRGISAVIPIVLIDAMTIGLNPSRLAMI